MQKQRKEQRTIIISKLCDCVRTHFQTINISEPSELEKKNNGVMVPKITTIILLCENLVGNVKHNIKF